MIAFDLTERIRALGKFSARPGLDRMRNLCKKLGNPQIGIPVIHIAGTNGKGSVSAMLDAVLRAAGYRVGRYTSPHLFRINERITLDGEEIPDDIFSGLAEEVFAAAEHLGEAITEFELLTAVAFLYFQKSRVDVMISEVGLGGRLDATNVIDESVLSVITGIDLDHTDILGSTIAEIAAEKAGIIKPGGRVLFGGNADEAKSVIAEIARSRGASFFESLGGPLRIGRMTADGTEFDFGAYRGMRLSLLGTYQIPNLATVMMALDLIKDRFPCSEGAIRKGLSSVSWRARMERFSVSPPIFCDGGHNPEGVAAALDGMKVYFPDCKFHILTGVMADKDYPKMASLLSSAAKDVFTVTPNSPRALPAEDYAKVFPRAEAYPAIAQGVAAAVAAAKADGAPLLSLGSLYLYPDVADALRALMH